MVEEEPIVETSTKKKKTFLGRLRKVGSSKNKNRRKSQDPSSTPTSSTTPEHDMGDVVPVPSIESRNVSSSGSDADRLQAAADAGASEEADEVQQQRAEMVARSVARDGTPVITSFNAHQFQPSDVRDEDIAPTALSDGAGSPAAATSKPVPSPERSTRRGRRHTVTLDKAPTARESAYGGPPKYDWIDIETAAAVKVQAAYRRNKAMKSVEEQGLSTAAIRNRNRARKSADADGERLFQTDDAPGLLACCGVGFLFGDATGEDQEVLAEERRKEYQKSKAEAEERERSRRKYRYRKKGSERMDEEFEVLYS